MRRANASEYHLFIGEFYPKDEEGNPLAINRVWHDLLAEDNPHILSEDILSAAIHSRRDLIKLDNLIRIKRLCSHWQGQEVAIEDILFTRKELDEARLNSGIDPAFFSKKQVLSARHREALALCQAIGEGKESEDWTEDLSKAAKAIADKGLHTSATAFLRKYRYVWNRIKGTYVVNPVHRSSLITRYSGRAINWTKEVGDE